jgi:hypothetical protein
VTGDSWLYVLGGIGVGLCIGWALDAIDAQRKKNAGVGLKIVV